MEGAGVMTGATLAGRGTGDEPCDFCLRIDGQMPERDWFDFKIIEYFDGIYTVPALGALDPGHLLLVPEEHVPASSDLTTDRRATLDRTREYWEAKLRSEWGQPVLIFEHGSTGENASAACIAHVHWQLLCTDYAEDATASLGDELETEGAPIDGPYLMARCSDRSVIRRSVNEPQYFRRYLAARAGNPERADYLLYPNLPSMNETIRRLYQYSRGSTDS